MRILTAVLLCMAIASIPALAGATTTPEGVLAELEAIFAAGDAQAYRALLAEDYEYLAANGAGWGKREDLTLTTRLFETAEVRLVFTRDFSIHPGDEPDTWILEGVPLDLIVTEDSRTNSVHAVISLMVRRDPDSGTVRIRRWMESGSKD